jgi:hypothetical protein
MSGLIRLFTLALLALPIWLSARGLSEPRGPLLVIGLLLAVLYLAVWLWSRPTGFAVTPGALILRWPVRRWEIPRADIASARRLEAEALKRELGFAARIGVGGLWGGFGWLWTRRRGLIDFYISRLDGYVMIERRKGRPLLVTPAEPAAFVEALRSD